MIIVVITSSILILSSPMPVSAKGGNNADTSNLHSAFSLEATPSSSSPLTSMSRTNVSPMDSDFTTQAALSLTRASQTNNFVASKAYYDISFRTATAGAIKTITMDFPAGTYVGSALIVEATGIGPGTLAASAGEVLTYTVTNAVNVPANTIIRIQMSNINNPPTPSASFTVTITTRNAANGVIDGPTATSAYNMVQVDNAQIAPGAVTTTKIATGAVTSGDIADGGVTLTKPAQGFMKKVTVFDDSVGNGKGWNPNGVATVFTVSEPLAGSPSEFGTSAIVNVDNRACVGGEVFSGELEVFCTTAPGEGSDLHYTIINLPPNINPP